VYCARPTLESDVRTIDGAAFEASASDGRVALFRGYGGVLRTCFRFRYKRLWLKLMVLLLLGRDFWLAVTEDRVVGLLGVRHDRLSRLPLNPGEACIYTVFVADELMGRRIGLYMLEQATIALWRRGCRLVLIETGEHNLSMRRMLDRSRLYEFCGTSQRPLPLPQRKSVL
jgi:GNAT superfamily N-acetyltransferase